MRSSRPYLVNRQLKQRVSYTYKDQADDIVWPFVSMTEKEREIERDRQRETEMIQRER